MARRSAGGWPEKATPRLPRGRRDPRDRRRDARRERRDARGPGDAGASADALGGHDDGRGQVGLRPDRRARADPVPAASARGSPRPDLPRLVPTLDWPPTRSRPSTRDTGTNGSAIAEDLVPRCAREGLAVFCDVFCEEGVFTGRRVAPDSGSRAPAGLGLRIHANELARSAGHCSRRSSGAELGGSPPVHRTGGDRRPGGRRDRRGLLPGTAWWMRATPAPARALIEAGVPVAIATDANPGTCNTESLPAVAAACLSRLRPDRRGNTARP